MGEIVARLRQAQVHGRAGPLDLDLRVGETVALMGPSGSGKTTVLRMLAGFDACDAGDVEIEGRLACARGMNLIAPEKRGISFAFQETALMPHMDAQQNICLGLRGSRSELHGAGKMALAEVGLSGFEKRKPWELSGGEAQRVQLARVCAANSRLMLLDEPFACVDRLSRADLVERLGQRLRHGGGAGCVLMVTHDPEDARELADVCVVMKGGRIEASGSFEQINGLGGWVASLLGRG